MARQLARLTAAAALLLALARLGRLLQDQSEGLPWQAVLLTAALLGAAFTWVLLSYRSGPIVIALVNVAAVTLAVLRLTAPDTLRYGLIPGAETWPAVGEQLGYAYELIRFGAAPVLPVPGLIALLAVAFWALGAVGAWSDAAARPLLGVAVPLVFYLQLATLDRRPPGAGWIAAFSLIAAAALIFAKTSQNGRFGRAFDTAGEPLARESSVLPAVTAIAAFVAALGSTALLASAVPESGAINWRSYSGVGSGLYGGTSFNMFVGLQQDLVSLSDEPMFLARLSEGAPANRHLYWKLITLDTFDGQNWIPSAQAFSQAGATRWEREDWLFRGSTVQVAANVRIEGLREQFLPTLYSPTALRSDEEFINDGFRVREDGSVAIDLRTRRGWEYEISATVPSPDVARLASLGEGLSPIFQEAADAGVFTGQAVEPRFEGRPEDMADYLDLPEGVPLDIRQLAREVTEVGITRFEQALVLEAWFRDPSIFTYSTEVSTGHTALDLADWLADPASLNYRTGYCEQFATAMAVMARTLGIPSRVVLGFTPGEIQQQGDGSDIVVVRERNAHAWVELWFDSQGWVRFDPTPRGDGVNPGLGQSTVGFDPREYVPAPDEPVDAAGNPLTGERPDLGGPEIDVTGGDGAVDVGGGRSPLELPVWLRWVLAIVVAGGIVPLIRQYLRRRRLRRMRSGDVNAAWEEIIARLWDLGLEVSDAETPVEIARRYDMVPLADIYSASVYGGVRMEGAVEAFENAERRLTDRYERPHRIYGWLVPRSLMFEKTPGLRRGLRPRRSAAR